MSTAVNGGFFNMAVAGGFKNRGHTSKQADNLCLLDSSLQEREY